jgi:hypothetical protein
MSAFSDYLEEALLEHIFHGVDYSAPTTLYLALFTSDPGDDNSGTELADSAYVRQDPADGGAIEDGWDAVEDSNDGEGRQVKNANSIEFPPIADGDVTISHWGLFDAEDGGNLLYHGAFDEPRDLKTDDVVSVSAGSLKIIHK